MAESNPEPGLLSDSSLNEPEQDQLGYADYAENLAEAMMTRIPREDFVVGIYGPWGSGKSTILNFIEYYLEEQDEPPLILRFNPWWFSGQADLIRKFFDQLESGLGADDRFENVRNKLSDFASSLSNVPISSGSGVPAEPILALIAEALATESEDLDSLKEEISQELRDADRRIVIMVDDIDRGLSESHHRHDSRSADHSRARSEWNRFDSIPGVLSQCRESTRNLSLRNPGVMKETPLCPFSDQETSA